MAIGPTGREVIVVSSAKARSDGRRDGKGDWAQVRGSPRTNIPANSSARVNADIILIVSRLLSLGNMFGIFRRVVLYMNTHPEQTPPWTTSAFVRARWRAARSASW